MNTPLTPAQIYHIKVAQMEAKMANHANEPSPFKLVLPFLPKPV